MATSRNIVLTYEPYDRTLPGFVRRYGYLDTALPRAVQIAMRVGGVRDVFVLHHAVTGLEIGTLKVAAQGHLVSSFVWDIDYAKSTTD